MRHEHLALAGVRLRQHLAVVAQPFSAEQAVLGIAVSVPAGRIAAPKAVQQLLRLHQRQVSVGADLDIEQHQVQVQKKYRSTCVIASMTPRPDA